MRSPIFDQMLFRSVPLLGDAFVQNGIVNWFADRSKKIHVPSHSRFLPTMKHLYQDNPNVQVIGPNVGDDYDLELYQKENNLSAIYEPHIAVYDIKVPRENEENSFVPVPVHWDQQMYEFYDLSFSLRYTNFRLPKDMSRSKELKKELLKGYDGPYALIHSEWGGSDTNVWNWIRARRFSLGLDINIPTIPLQAGKTDSLLDWYHVIIDASEVHCTPSGPQCFVDSIWNHCKGKLFYHWARIETHIAVNNRYNQNCWQIELYDHRVD